MKESAGLCSSLSAKADFRERLDILRSNPFYLILSSLRLAFGMALKKYDKDRSQILDFDREGNPYRSFFQFESIYLRPDLGGGPGQARYEPTEPYMSFQDSYP